MTELGRSAIGTWGGGRYMRFGEAIDDDRLEALFRPGDGIDTVITADVYGEGEADRTLGRALAGLDRESYRVAGAIGHDYIHGERQGPKGFPRFTHPDLRGQDGYAAYLREAAERSLEAVGIDAFDVLLLHNPDRTGYESPAVWEGMAALREDGLAHAVGVAPGPANGFTLDLIACLERYGDVIDWAMVILNPLEPWPGELVLDAAAAADVSVITRVVDYGGLFWGDLEPDTPLHEHDHRRFRPTGWIERGTRPDRCDAAGNGISRTFADGPRVPVESRAPGRCLRCADPDPGGRPGRSPNRRQASGSGRRADRAASLIPSTWRRSASWATTRGSMKLKGANAEHEGEDAPDRWGLSPELVETGERHGIAPERDLSYAG